jgi:hypothetical protein
MIDALVDNTLCSYLGGVLAASGYPSFTVVRGMEDNLPDLACPYIVVHSAIERFAGRDQVYELRTRIELHSVTGMEPVSNTESIMSIVDRALIQKQNVSVPTSGLLYFGWEGIMRSELVPGDRRANLREITVFSQLS